MTRRPRTWITDMRHYLDEGMLADMPAPAVDLALHLGAIVAWVSSHAGARRVLRAELEWFVPYLGETTGHPALELRA